MSTGLLDFFKYKKQELEVEGDWLDSILKLLKNQSICYEFEENHIKFAIPHLDFDIFKIEEKYFIKIVSDEPDDVVIKGFLFGLFKESKILSREYKELDSLLIFIENIIKIIREIKCSEHYPDIGNTSKIHRSFLTKVSGYHLSKKGDF